MIRLMVACVPEKLPIETHSKRDANQRRERNDGRHNHDRDDDVDHPAPIIGR
jgi:hypothetical protein